MSPKVTTIPSLDLNDYLNGNTEVRQKFIQDVGHSLQNIGFFSLKNHNVDLKNIDKAYAQMQIFFNQKQEDKLKAEDPKRRNQRGYIRKGTEKAKDQSAYDLKEFYQIGQFLPENHPHLDIYGDNVWPTDLKDFKNTFVAMYKDLEICAKYILEACAIYIGPEAAHLPEMIDLGDSIFRLIHYPALEANRDPAAVRAAAHEDINLITLLCESTASGLEILQNDGSWLPIHAQHGDIIIDSGDMIQQLTNGLLKSTTHRVVNPDDGREARYSLPFFAHPRAAVDISPLPSCIEKTGGKKRYQSSTAGEYLEQRLIEIGLKK